MPPLLLPPPPDLQGSEIEVCGEECGEKFLAEGDVTAHFPTVDALRSSVQTYFEAFDIHLPIFHIQSFQAAAEIPQQLLAVAAIGALYCRTYRASSTLERKGCPLCPGWHPNTTTTLSVCLVSWNRYQYAQDDVQFRFTICCKVYVPSTS